MSASGERHWFSRSVIWAGLLMLASGVAVAVWRALLRTELGYWTPYSTGQLLLDLGLPEPHASGALQGTLESLMNAPAAGVLAVAGCLVAGTAWLASRA